MEAGVGLSRAPSRASPPTERRRAPWAALCSDIAGTRRKRRGSPRVYPRPCTWRMSSAASCGTRRTAPSCRRTLQRGGRWGCQKVRRLGLTAGLEVGGAWVGVGVGRVVRGARAGRWGVKGGVIAGVKGSVRAGRECRVTVQDWARLAGLSPSSRESFPASPAGAQSRSAHGRQSRGPGRGTVGCEWMCVEL